MMFAGPIGDADAGQLGRRAREPRRAIDPPGTSGWR
jgi:hypothetical protein